MAQEIIENSGDSFRGLTGKDGEEVLYRASKIMENKKIKDEEDFFDDCPICQAMKLAKEQGREPTLEELKEAFERAKEQGGMVGGEWFEENQK